MRGRFRRRTGATSGRRISRTLEGLELVVGELGALRSGKLAAVALSLDLGLPSVGDVAVLLALGRLFIGPS